MNIFGNMNLPYKTSMCIVLLPSTLSPSWCKTCVMDSRSIARQLLQHCRGIDCSGAISTCCDRDYVLCSPSKAAPRTVSPAPTYGCSIRLLFGPNISAKAKLACVAWQAARARPGCLGNELTQHIFCKLQVSRASNELQG